MKEAVEVLVPKLLAGRVVDWKTIDHGSKHALLTNLPARMRGYAKWPEPGLRVMVVVDRDDDDCRDLKRRLEQIAVDAGLFTKASPDHARRFKVVNRVAVEELEAWFLGDVAALVEAYPRLPASLARRAAFRDPDAVMGGTWQALLRALHRAGYYVGMPLPKIEVARRVAPLMTINRNTSNSFRAFVMGLESLLAASS